MDVLIRMAKIAALAFVLIGELDAGSDLPNIVWIYADDHSHKAISAYGESHVTSVARTPNIDRLADEGALFANSFVTNSICGPARAVVLTGKHSHLNGFRHNKDTFDGSQQSFVKLLRERAEYRTAVIGKWHLKSEPQGFDHWDVLPGQGHYYNPEFVNASGSYVEQGYVTDLITRKGLEWLERTRSEGRPFMLMLQHKAPHREWMPALDKLALYDEVLVPEPSTLFDDYEGRGAAARMQDMEIGKSLDEVDFKLLDDPSLVSALEPGLVARWKDGYLRLSEAQRKVWDEFYAPIKRTYLEQNLKGDALLRWKYQRYIKDYLRTVSSVDDSVGEVLDYLDRSGLSENTVVFYSSDQSFFLGEHGWFDKRFMYEEGMRTPLLVRWPGMVEQGLVVDELVQNLDMAQTFLDIAAIEAPEDMQGKSLLPLMKGERFEVSRSSLYYHYYHGMGSGHNVHRHDGVRTERYKLIDFYTLGEYELYDLEQDPEELVNVYGKKGYEDLAARLLGELVRARVRYGVEDPRANY